MVAVTVGNVDIETIMPEAQEVADAGKKIEEETQGKDEQAPVECDGEPSSVSSVYSSTSGSKNVYQIVPTNNASPGHISQLSEAIVAAVGTNSMDGFILPTGSCFWAIMNPAQAQALQSAPASPSVELETADDEQNVFPVRDDTPSKLPRRHVRRWPINTRQPSSNMSDRFARRAIDDNFSPLGEYFFDSSAPVELRFVSTGEDDAPWAVKDYVYNGRGGAGINVFVMDSGANKQNPYLANMLGP